LATVCRLDPPFRVVTAPCPLLTTLWQGRGDPSRAGRHGQRQLGLFLGAHTGPNPTDVPKQAASAMCDEASLPLVVENDASNLHDSPWRSTWSSPCLPFPGARATGASAQGAVHDGPLEMGSPLPCQASSAKGHGAVTTRKAGSNRQTVANSAAAATAHFGRQGLPGNSRFQHKHNSLSAGRCSTAGDRLWRPRRQGWQ